MIQDFFKKWSCCHEWRLISKTDIYKNSESKIPCKVVATFVCKKCGKFKKIDL